MKGNDGTGNMVERDEWQTPQWLFDKLNQQYKFVVDCCATNENKKCSNYCIDFTKPEIYIDRMSFMNPPFSKAEIMFKCFFDKVKKGVCIYRCDNIETKLWNMLFKKSSWIFVFDKRINYEGHEGKGSRFGSALIGFNVEPPKGLNGCVLKEKKNEK